MITAENVVFVENWSGYEQIVQCFWKFLELLKLNILVNEWQIEEAKGGIMGCKIIIIIIRQ